MVNLDNKVFTMLLIAFISRIFFIEYFGDIGWEPDSYLHYLLAESAFINLPESLRFTLGVWAKPLYTLIFGFLIYITGIKSLFLFKLINSIFWIVVCYLVYLITKKLDFSETQQLIATAFTSFSFIAYRSSITELTEPLFTLLIISALLLLINKKYYFSSLLISLSILSRMEGFIFLVLWLVFIPKNIRIKNFLILISFPLLWNIAGYAIYNQPFFIFSSGYSLKNTLYGTGNFWVYPAGLLLYEPIIFILFLIGYVRNYKSTKFFHINLIIITYLMFEVISYKFGIFGSLGLLRYLVPVIPILSIYAASALDKKSFMISRYNTKNIIFIIILIQISFTFVILNSNTSYQYLYNTPTVDPNLIDAGKWIYEQNFDEKLYSTDPTIIYYAKRNHYSSGSLSSYNLGSAKGILVWDSGFGPRESNITFDKMDKFELIKSFGKRVYIYIK